MKRFGALLELAVAVDVIVGPVLSHAPLLPRVELAMALG
jgi:hypothetical protein